MIGIFVLVGVFMLAVSIYAGGSTRLTCDRDRSVDCTLETRRYWNSIVVEEQHLYDLQRVSVRSRSLELIAKDGTITALMGEPAYVEASGAILKAFIASRDPGPISVEETDWAFSNAAGIFSAVWLLATAGLAIGFAMHTSRHRSL